MTGREIAKSFCHYAGEFCGYHLSPDSVGMAAEMARVEQNYGIKAHERVSPDVAATVLRHLRYSFHQNHRQPILIQTGLPPVTLTD